MGPARAALLPVSGPLRRAAPAPLCGALLNNRGHHELRRLIWRRLSGK